MTKKPGRKPKGPLLLIVGTPMEGFDYYGPFDEYDEAETYAQEGFDGDWWIVKLHDV